MALLAVTPLAMSAIEMPALATWFPAPVTETKPASAWTRRS